MGMANWQNYRSTVNGMPAVFTANIEDVEKYHGKDLDKIVQFTIAYKADDESGLPDILFVIPKLKCIFTVSMKILL